MEVGQRLENPFGNDLEDFDLDAFERTIRNDIAWFAKQAPGQGWSNVYPAQIPRTGHGQEPAAHGQATISPSSQDGRRPLPMSINWPRGGSPPVTYTGPPSDTRPSDSLDPAKYAKLPRRPARPIRPPAEHTQRDLHELGSPLLHGGVELPPIPEDYPDASHPAPSGDSGRGALRVRRAMSQSITARPSST